MANTAIGVDFGHSSIKIVEVRRRGRQVAIQRAALLPIPKGTIRNGLLLSEGMLAETLSEISPTLRLDRAAVVAGITGSQVMIRNLTLNDVETADLTPLVFQELAALLRLAPEEIENYVFDYHVLPSDTPVKQEVVTVGLDRQAVNTFVNLLRQARLAPHILDVEAFCLPRALPILGRACYIELGAENTQIYITSDSEYVLYRLIPSGMARLNLAIANAYNITVAEASALQLRTHIDKLISEAPGDRSSLQRIVEELVSGIIQTLEFLRARQRATSIHELLQTGVLCGGGALPIGITQLLSEEIGLPLTIARPLSGHPGADTLSADILAMEPVFAGAMGLALRGVAEL